MHNWLGVTVHNPTYSLSLLALHMEVSYISGHECYVLTLKCVFFYYYILHTLTTALVQPRLSECNWNYLQFDARPFCLFLYLEAIFTGIFTFF